MKHSILPYITNHISAHQFLLCATIPAVVKTTLDCNYYKTMEASRTFLQLLKAEGRLVNVASTTGQLNRYSDDV